MALVVIVLAVLGPAAPASQAPPAAGSAQEKPRKDANLGRAPIAIGDSPMLLALPDLATIGYRANARGCRQWPEGLALIRKLETKDHLPQLVVIALGSNGSVTRANIHDALDIVGKKRILGPGHAARDRRRLLQRRRGRPRGGEEAREPDLPARLGRVQRPATRTGSSPTACT